MGKSDCDMLYFYETMISNTNGEISYLNDKLFVCRNNISSYCVLTIHDKINELKYYHDKYEGFIVKCRSVK